MLYIHCLGDLSKNKQDGSSLQSLHSAQNLAAKHNRNFDKYSVCYYNNEKNLHRNSGTVFLQREIWIMLWSEQSFNLNISPNCCLLQLGQLVTSVGRASAQPVTGGMLQGLSH